MAKMATQRSKSTAGISKELFLASSATQLSEDNLVAKLSVLANEGGAGRFAALVQDGGKLQSHTQFPIQTTVTTARGATATINPDGTVTYDASAIRSTLQQYAAGETVADTFQIGTTQVTVELAGVNDAPTVAAVLAATLHDTPGNTVAPPVTGTLQAHDVDHGATLTVGFGPSVSSSVGLNGNLVSTSDFGTLQLNAATGSYAFVAEAGHLNALGKGETVSLAFAVQAKDEHGATSSATHLTFHLAGANDTPTLGAALPVDIADTAEAATAVSVQGTLQGADADQGAVLTYGFAAGVAYTTNAQGKLISENDFGTFALDPATGAYEFTANPSRLDTLQSGETASVHFAVQARDEHGAASSATTVTFNLVGADEAPAAPTAPVDNNPIVDFSLTFLQSMSDVFRLPDTVPSESNLVHAGFSGLAAYGFDGNDRLVLPLRMQNEVDVMLDDSSGNLAFYLSHPFGYLDIQLIGTSQASIDQVVFA